MGCSPRPLVEECQGELVAAVVDVVEDRPVALGRVLRSEDEDVGLELDHSVLRLRGA